MTPYGIDANSHLLFSSNIFWPMFVETHKLDKCAGFNDKSLFAAKEVYHNYHSWSDFDLQSPAYI